MFTKKGGGGEGGGEGKNKGKERIKIHFLYRAVLSKTPFPTNLSPLKIICFCFFQVKLKQ